MFNRDRARRREEPIEECDDASRIGRSGEAREAPHVCEQARDLTPNTREQRLTAGAQDVAHHLRVDIARERRLDPAGGPVPPSHAYDTPSCGPGWRASSISARACGM